MKLLIPLVLAVGGLGAGVGAGFFMRPSPSDTDIAVDSCGEGDMATAVKPAKRNEGKKAEPIFVNLDHQFVVPLIEDGRVSALVVMSLTLETDAATQDIALARKPRLRDRFLRVMLDHANTGGFEGNFTSNGQIDQLKRALFETASAEIGSGLYDILLLDIVKQAA